jgi:large subunit ribosomal protein L25
MKTISITANVREKKGRSGANATRRDERIPGVLYGQGKNIPLSVDRKEFVKAMAEAHGENVLFDVTFPKEAPLKSILREIQHDVLHRYVTHIDFQHIDLTKKIHVKVAIHLHGEPEGVKTFGGILEHTTREVEILCLPAEIPPHFDVDVSKLLIGNSLHVSDLLRGNYEILEEPTRVIAQVTAPTVEKIAEPEVTEAVVAEGAATEEGAKAEGAKPAKGEGAKAEAAKPGKEAAKPAKEGKA